MGFREYKVGYPLFQMHNVPHELGAGWGEAREAAARHTEDLRKVERDSDAAELWQHRRSVCAICFPTPCVFVL